MLVKTCSRCQSSVLVLSLGRLCWEGLCLVRSSECCIKVCEPSPFVSLCSPNLFHHLLELWLLPAVPLSFLGTAAIHWGWVKLASISKLPPWFLEDFHSFIAVMHFSSSLSRQKLCQLPSASPLKCCYTSHCFTLSPQTHYFNPSSLYNVLITFTIVSQRLKMQTHKTE